jgi:SCY1-like protein 2
MLKRGVSQLTRLRHPRILNVERSLEESRDCYAFCTEPIFASLANCFGDLDNVLNPPRQLKNFELQDVEIRHGLFQVTINLFYNNSDILNVGI